ncbi:MAG: hypothetical protein KatS3mg031_1032 [Chitinophagales bacterium]|nr:MAG: hypothetical protein KatS3mg031_1032 [Chitinophagales bacterium]
MWGKITKGKALLLVISATGTATIAAGQVSPIQISRNQTYTTRYWDYDALQVNPANIAAQWQPGRKLSFGLLSSNFTLYSAGVKNDLLHDGKVSNLASLSHWVNDILPARNAFNLENTIFGMHFHIKNAGAFAISARSQVYGEAEFNGMLENLNLDNTTIDQLPDILLASQEDNSQGNHQEPSYLRFSSVAEINFGHSIRIVNTPKTKLYFGSGVKYLMGLADMGLQFNGQELAGYYSLSSMLPKEWIDSNYASYIHNDKKYGHGFGASVGFALKWDNKLHVGLSVVDLGFIRWPAHRFYLKATDAVVAAVTEHTVEDAVEKVMQDFQRKEDGTELQPARVIVGASYAVHRYVHFYLDFISPLYASPRGLTYPTLGVGTWLSLKDIITLKTGLVLAAPRLITLPVYLSFYGGKRRVFEMSFGTSDVLSFILPQRPYMNVETVMMKYHF